MIRSAIIMIFAIVNVSATEWKPPARLLQAVRKVESADGLYTYGDEGRSLGDYQMSEAAWLDVTSWRKSKGLRAYPYSQHVYDRAVSRQYASDYIGLLRTELQKKLKRVPDAGEIYAAYNMGMATFATCDYKSPASTP